MRAAALWSVVSTYFSNPDPRLNLGGTVALAVVGNQPFYPLYVSYLTGVPAWPAALTWLSTPFFAAAPSVMRRSPATGRILLLAAALGNTVLSAKALGPASGVELFYVPCVLLAFGLFEPGRRAMPVAIVTACVAIGWAVARLDGAPLQIFSADQSDCLWSMNKVSVVCLCGVIAFVQIRVSRVSRSA